MIAGGLYGLLIGDAFGVPYEFHDPSNLPPEDTLEPVPPEGFHRSHRGVPVGTWSDDGAQALALLDSLLTCGGLDLDDLGRRFVGWWSHGAYTPDTTAAVAGGIAGLRHGMKGIPTQWVAMLHGRDQVETLLHRLEVHRGTVP